MLEEAPVASIVRAAAELQLRTPDEEPGTICFCPVIDGDVLPERPLDAFKAGRAHPVPLIIGTNDREGSVFTGRRDILATTKPRIRAIFAATAKPSRKALKKLYPGLPDRPAALDFGGDYAFWFPSIKVAERHARHQPVRFYRFDAAPRILRVAGVDAFHGLELWALYDRMRTPLRLGDEPARRSSRVPPHGRPHARPLGRVRPDRERSPTGRPTSPERRRTLVIDDGRPGRGGPAGRPPPGLAGVRAARLSAACGPGARRASGHLPSTSSCVPCSLRVDRRSPGCECCPVDLTLIVVLVIVLALFFDFTNGFHDTANAMATPIATGAMKPKVAVTVAAVLNLVGAFLSTEVAKTVSGGIIREGDGGVQISPEMIFAGLIGAVVWNMFTWLRGLPSSSSHALFGGLIGAAVVGAGLSSVDFSVVLSKVVLPALLAPLIAGLVGYTATRLAYRITRRRTTRASGAASATARSSRRRWSPSPTARTTPRRRWASSP